MPSKSKAGGDAPRFKAPAEEWQDITELCRDAARQLGVDEMIHKTTFSLQEAMSALELMEPRMDKETPVMQTLQARLETGALPAHLGESLPCLEALEGIMEGLLVCEVAFLEGGSLPETLFTLLYAHPEALAAIGAGLGVPYSGSGYQRLRIHFGTEAAGNETAALGAPFSPPPRSAVTASLFAYVLATLRCCAIAKDIINLADVFEEEDFYMATFDLRLSPLVEDDSILGLLETAESLLVGMTDPDAITTPQTAGPSPAQTQAVPPAAPPTPPTTVSATASRASSQGDSATAPKTAGSLATLPVSPSTALAAMNLNGPAPEDGPPPAAPPHSGGRFEAMRSRVLLHLQLRRQYLRAMLALKNGCKRRPGQAQTEGAAAEGGGREVVENQGWQPPAVCMRRAVQELGPAISALQLLCAEPRPPKGPPKGHLEGAGSRAGFAFEPEFNRHLLGSTPHRFVPLRPPEEALRCMLEVLGGLRGGLGVVECDTLAQTRAHLISLNRPPLAVALAEGGSYPGPNILVRSAAAVCLYRADLMLARHPVEDFISEAMTQAGVPAALLTSHAGAQLVDQAAKPVYESLRLLTLNRARQRGRLDQLIAEWIPLQTQAAEADEVLGQEYQLPPGAWHYLSDWTLLEMLGLMALYIQTGIELELPSDHEWHSLFWYWSYLLSARLRVAGGLAEARRKLDAAKAAITQEEEAAQRAAAAAGSAAEGSAKPSAAAIKKKKKKAAQRRRDGNPPEAAPPPGAAEPPYRYPMDMALDQLFECLSTGALRFVSGLQAWGVLDSANPPSPLVDPLMIFQRRHLAFAAVQAPPPLSYIDFLERACPEEISETAALGFLESSSECFRGAKRLLDRLRSPDRDSLFEEPSCLKDDELVGLTKVAIANSVSILKVREHMRTTHQGGCCRVVYSFSTHVDFPVISLEW